MNTKNKEFVSAIKATQKTHDKMTFGSLIRSLRICDEISQIDLAKKLKVSRQFLNDVEHNRKEIGICFAKKVADTLGYSVAPMIELLIRDQLKKQKLNYTVSLSAQPRA